MEKQSSMGISGGTDVFYLKTYGLLAAIGLTEDNFKELTTLFFTVALAFGVFNNPTSKDNF